MKHGIHSQIKTYISSIMNSIGCSIAMHPLNTECALEIHMYLASLDLLVHWSRRKER